MSDPLEDGPRRPSTVVPQQLARVARAVRVDLARLHGAWMATALSSDLRGDHSVVEQREPETVRAAVGYRLWALLGAVFVAVAYPLVAVGLATRYYARRIDRFTAGIGLAGVAAVSVLVWGAFTAATYVSPIAFEGFVAVAVAGVVATAAAVLARVVTRRAGRVGSVAVGYPLGVTAIFLPPVVASLYSPTLASVVFPGSESLAIWILDNLLSVGGLAAFIRASFDLEGLAYVGMWFGLAVPTGWLLGTLVWLAGAVRPSAPPDPAADVDAVFARR